MEPSSFIVILGRIDIYIFFLLSAPNPYHHFYCIFELFCCLRIIVSVLWNFYVSNFTILFLILHIRSDTNVLFFLFLISFPLVFVSCVMTHSSRMSTKPPFTSVYLHSHQRGRGSPSEHTLTLSVSHLPDIDPVEKYTEDSLISETLTFTHTLTKLKMLRILYLYHYLYILSCLSDHMTSVWRIY